MKFELYKDVQIKNDIHSGYAVERFNFIGETI